MSTPSSVIQTQELIAAVAVLVLKAKAASPGGFSIWEIIGLAKEWPMIAKALEGIDRVPAELLDLSSDEAVQIGEQVSIFMVELGFPHRSGDITQEVVRAAASVVTAWRNIVNLPPIPVIVP
jgi:hypothetical protein